MNIEKAPFRSYTLDKDKTDPLDKGKIFTIRLSASEYKELLVMAKVLHISRDSTLIKKLAFIGKNVIIQTFGLDFLSWLTDDKRVIDDEKLDQLVIEKKENVTQK